MQQAKIDEAIADAKNMKFMYFAYVKIFGRPETAEGLKEAEDSFQALNDLRFKVRIKQKVFDRESEVKLYFFLCKTCFRMGILIWLVIV